MPNNKIFPYLYILFLIIAQEVTYGRNPADYINPFIGASTSAEAAGVAHGLGKTFPGATSPFGMVQVSPNTITGGDNGSGYSYEHTSIEGFAFTQMSGVGWYGDLGNLLVMPTTGPLKTVAGKEGDTSGGYRSGYSKPDEKASAGYYSVLLSDYNIQAEATASKHCGALRFTFPENNQSRIQIDLARRVGGTSVYQYVQVIDHQTLRGWMKCTPDGGGWGNGAGKADYTVYFYIRLNKPFKKFGYWKADIPGDWERKREEVTSDWYQQRISEAEIIQGATEMEGKHIGFYAEYDTHHGEVIEMKAGISFVDMKGAETNYRKEAEDQTFDQIRANTYNEWNKALSKIIITGGSEDQKTIFYTALYHTMIDPRTFADVDGRYPGGDHRPHTADRFSKRTIFSGWDVFRSQFPLQTLINPDVVNDAINSLITLAEETGYEYFERWEFLNAYSGCMIGNPAISVLADAYFKGIRDYDITKAYQYALKTSSVNGNGSLGYSADGNSISNTLEYAYSDWCMAQLAKELGHEADFRKFSNRAKAYKLIFDPSEGWFRPKNANGAWEEWPEEGRLKEGYGCVESNPYQQGWFVPHDIQGMIELMGGKKKTLADLTVFFEKTPSHFLWNSYYNHANEPVHHVPFLFNRLDSPQLTQYWTRYICDHAYQNKVEGLVGNEDVGQMSAWYVLAASGIHPVCPGNPHYEITSPVFNSIVFKAGPEENTFTIIAHNNSPGNVYIERMLLNGKPYNRFSISHDELIRGGKLELFMSSKYK